MYTVYSMHRRINASLEFQGLKAQYIFYAGVVVVGDMMLFALLYIVGVNNYVCLLFCFGIGAAGISSCFYLSRRYGPYGWRKRRMVRKLPTALRARGRMVFLRLKK